MEEINNFQQEPDKTLYQACERFKELLMKCPQHYLTQMQERNNANPSYQERRQSMEDTLSKFMSESAKRHEENSNLIKEIRATIDAAIRNQGASIKTLEIQIGKMSKIVYKGDNVVGALMNVPIFVGTFSVMTDFAVLKDMDAYLDEGMNDIIVGEPINPQHTPIITQPSTSQPQKKQKPRKPKRRDTEASQPSGLTTNLAEEAIKEENVPTHSNDPLLSGEDRLKLKELMALWLRRLYKVGLSARVISSEDEGLGEEDASKHGRKIHDIDADKDITLENVHDEDMFDTSVFNGKEVFAGQDMAEKEVSTADPVTTAGEVVTTANVEVSTANPTAATITTVELTLAQTLAELKSARPKTRGVVMQEPSESTPTTTTISSKDKGKAEEQEELTIEEKSKLFVQLLEKRRKFFAAKRVEEKRNKPPTKAQQRSIMPTYLKNMAGWKPKDLKTKSFANIQDLFNKAMKRVNTFVDMDKELVEGSETKEEESSKRAGDELKQDKSKKHKLDENVEAEVDDAKEAEELKKCLEIVPDNGDDVTIDATPLSVKILIRRLGSSLEIVKARFKKTKPVNYMDTFLHLNLKSMFEHHVEDSIWKNQQGLVKVLNWKLFDSCGVHCVTVKTILSHPAKAETRGGVDEAERKFDQLAKDEEIARKVQEDWEAEEEMKKGRERETFTVEEKVKFLYDTIAAQRRFLAQQRTAAIRSRPPTRTQLRNQMMTYLKHVGGKKHADLKNKNFKEIQVLYKEVKRSDKNFIAIGSAEDERQIKEMNEESKDPKKKRLKKRVVNETPREEDTAKVPAEQEVTEQGTKKRKSGHVKMIARKRPRPQPDDDSDDEHRKCLRIVTFDSTIDSEIMETKSFVSKLHKVSSPDGDYLVVYRVNGHFRAFNYLMEVLHIFDRQDLFHLYDLVMKQYSEITPEGIELILWGDLKIMMESSTEENDQELKDGTVIYMLVERRYPLSKELLQRMLDLGLEVDEESTAALHLVRFIKQRLNEE
ncbi:hypothetical protein Tco_0400553 [Tanacetum coccineum]